MDFVPMPTPAAALERLGDKARRLHVLDEGAQIGSAFRAALGRAHGLLDFHEMAVHHPHLWMILGISHQRLLHPGGNLELVVDEHVDHRLAAADRRAYDSGVLDRARQIEIVGRLETCLLYTSDA